MKNKNKNKHGQVLLVVVLLLATTLTVVMTVIFTSRSETTISRLQQDSDKSLAAAEAGIEAAINSQSVGTVNFSNLEGVSDLSGIDVTNSNVTVDNSNTSGYFVSPLISKDQQYTLYLAEYSNSGFGNYYGNGSLDVYYGTETACDQVALELSIVGFTNGNIDSTITVKRLIADYGNTIFGPDATNNVGSNTPTTIDGQNFACKATIPTVIPNNAKLLFVRVLGSSSGTKIGINDTSLAGQGAYYSSEAKTTTGVTKKVRVFKSHPQLPAELFVTKLDQPDNS